MLYEIPVDNMKEVKGLLVEEDMVEEVCEWAAEMEDHYYRLHDIFYTDQERQEIKKDYKTHLNKIWDFVQMGAQIIKK